MKFRTEVNLKNSTSQLTYSDKIMLVGSCFSVNIHNKLNHLKFDTSSNPFGIVYNPISLAHQLERILDNNPYTNSDLQFHNERWFSFDHHSDFSFTDKETCLTSINTSLSHAHQNLITSNFLFITLGSSWVYTLNETNKTVSNCHKISASSFTKSLATTEDMVNMLTNAIKRIKQTNKQINIIFSISPVRHLGDGFFENQVSKGRLFDVIHQLRNHQFINYFPAYEIVLDDLRDYRFYNSDLVHPSEEAIKYVWEKFVSVYLSKNALSTVEKVQNIIQAVNHRPFNPNSEAHQKFIQKTLKEIDELESCISGNFQQEKVALIKY